MPEPFLDRLGVGAEGDAKGSAGVAEIDVADALAGLADLDDQKRAWLAGEVPHGTYDDLTLAVHILYDDMTVLPDPAEAVGAVLHPGDEVRALRSLGEVFGPLIDRLGNAPDASYLSAAEWPEVVRRAGVALASMVRKGGVDHPPVS